MLLDLISATCYPDNLRSRRVLEKCGFVYRDAPPGELLFNGEVRDPPAFLPARKSKNKTYIFCEMCYNYYR